MKTKSLFIAAIFNLNIQEDLGEGVEVLDGIKLTNNPTTIGSLFNNNLESALGKIETTTIKNADAIFYSIINVNINPENMDDLVCNMMAKCKIFINDLWLIKDNCIDIMAGYITYPYLNSIYTLDPPITHTNSISTSFSNALGQTDVDCHFSKEEITDAVKIYPPEEREILKFSETSKKNTNFEKGMPRVFIGNILTQTARSQSDLGLKISHYCTALESLFATDNAELSHKLSERIAFFLEKESDKRKEVYKLIKNIYKVRSIVLHGSSIKKVDELPKISEKADDIIRKIFIKLNNTPELDKYFRKRGDNGLDKYLSNLIFDS